MVQKFNVVIKNFHNDTDVILLTKQPVSQRRALQIKRGVKNNINHETCYVEVNKHV